MSEIKIRTCLEEYGRHAARIHLVKEKKYALVQMISVDEAKSSIRDFERKPPKICHMRSMFLNQLWAQNAIFINRHVTFLYIWTFEFLVPVTFSRKPLNAVLVEQKLEAFKNTAELKMQSGKVFYDWILEIFDIFGMQYGYF